MLQRSNRCLTLYPWLLPDGLAPKLSERPSMFCIAEQVAARHGLALAEMRGPRRFKTLVYARQQFMWEAYQTGHWSSGQIARFFGDMDHSTVVAGRRAHAERNGLATW